MTQPRLFASSMSALLSWILTGLAWVVSNMAFVAGGCAVVASVYSIIAARETIKLRRAQRKRVEQGNGTEPEI